MGAFDLVGKRSRLEPLGQDSWGLFTGLAAREDLTRASLMYPMDFNLSFSSEGIRRIALQPETGQRDRLYMARETEGAVFGLIGITDTDWVQRRGALVLLMGETALREKRSYEPLKLLILKAFQEWDLRRLTAMAFTTDAATVAVLKGFGFQQEGVLRSHVVFRAEALDVGVFGVLKAEFRHVEA